MQAVTEEQILAALSAVQDPSQNKDIVALGLVQAIQIKDSNISFMLVVPPHRGPAMEPIRKRAEQVALSIEGVTSATVLVTAHESRADGLSASSSSSGTADWTGEGKNSGK